MEEIAITFSDRLIAGLMSAVLMTIVVVCIPVGAMLFVTKGRGLELLGIFGSFHIWGMSLIALASIVGTALGTDRTIILFGHMWGTIEPKR